MKPINQEARKVLDLLTKDLGQENNHRRVDTSSFMAVVVEYLREIEFSSVSLPIYSVTHYYEQNGDMMRDPDMEFMRGKDGQYYPIYFRQDGVAGLCQEVLAFDDEGKIKGYRPRLQRELATFAGVWMRNIKHQQDLATIAA